MRRTFSALQRAEIAEIRPQACMAYPANRAFSALQRAEIAEIVCSIPHESAVVKLSVLFNEPKLLKFVTLFGRAYAVLTFSALQRAEIAEMMRVDVVVRRVNVFQCSSTSRNC